MKSLLTLKWAIVNNNNNNSNSNIKIIKNTKGKQKVYKLPSTVKWIATKK